jgi:hypothetical protein
MRAAAIACHGSAALLPSKQLDARVGVRRGRSRAAAFALGSASAARFSFGFSVAREREVRPSGAVSCRVAGAIRSRNAKSVGYRLTVRPGRGHAPGT